MCVFEYQFTIFCVFEYMILICRQKSQNNISTTYKFDKIALFMYSKNLFFDHVFFKREGKWEGGKDKTFNKPSFEERSVKSGRYHFNPDFYQVWRVSKLAWFLTSGKGNVRHLISKTRFWFFNIAEISHVFGSNATFLAT